MDHIARLISEKAEAEDEEATAQEEQERADREADHAPADLYEDRCVCHRSRIAVFACPVHGPQPRQTAELAHLRRSMHRAAGSIERQLAFYASHLTTHHPEEQPVPEPHHRNPYRERQKLDSITVGDFAAPSVDDRAPGLTARDLDHIARQHFTDGARRAESDLRRELRIGHAEQLAEAFDEGYDLGGGERHEQIERYFTAKIHDLHEQAHRNVAAIPDDGSSVGEGEGVDLRNLARATESILWDVIRDFNGCAYR